MNGNLFTPNRNDTVAALKPEGMYLSMSHKTDNMPQISRGTVHSNSDEAFMLVASHLNGSMGPTFESTDPMFPTSERLYMPSSSQRYDIPTAERMYIPGASHDRNETNPSSERLYISTNNSERMYNQNPIISMDELPSQALSSSQRI